MLTKAELIEYEELRSRIKELEDKCYKGLFEEIEKHKNDSVVELEALKSTLMAYSPPDSACRFKMILRINDIIDEIEGNS